MSDNRDSLERELSALLAVQPSPHLEARIRSRISGYPQGRRLRFRLPLLAASLVCAVILLTLTRQQPHVPPAALLTPQSTIAESLPVVAQQEATAITPVQLPIEKVSVENAEDSVSVSISYDASGMNTLEIDPIVVQPLRRLEIAETIQPLPEMRLPEIPALMPMEIPALDLSTQQTEVNE